jgi:hypothetical protein
VILQAIPATIGKSDEPGLGPFLQFRPDTESLSVVKGGIRRKFIVAFLRPIRLNLPIVSRTNQLVRRRVADREK